MDLALTSDEEQLVSTFEALFRKWATSATIRETEALGFDQHLWELVVAVGAPSMGVAWDGADAATFVQLALVAECFGRHLAPIPLVESMVAIRLLDRSAHADAELLVRDVAAGTVVPTISLRRSDDGVARLVPAGAVASLIVALDGDDLIAVVAEPPGSVRQNLGSMAIADRHLTAGQRVVLGSGPAAVRLFDQALLEWKTLTAAALVGLSAGALSIGASNATRDFA